MRWGSFVAGVLVGAAGMFAMGIYWLISREKVPSENDILFSPKAYHESEFIVDAGLVYIAGTMTGQGLAYPNNTYSITCYQNRRECLVAYAEAIGGNQIGRMDMPTIYPVVKWSGYEIVAQDEVTEIGCVRVTITIERKTESALWVEEPVNQTKPSCKNSDGKTRKYTIEDSPGWKKIFGNR